MVLNDDGACDGCAGCESVDCECDDCEDCECDESEDYACDDCEENANAVNVSVGCACARSLYPSLLHAVPMFGQSRRRTLLVLVLWARTADHCILCLEIHLHSLGVLHMCRSADCLPLSSAVAAPPQ